MIEGDQNKSYFDEILTNRLGFGQYQICNFISVSFIDFIDGFDMLAMAILLPIFKFEFLLNDSEVKQLASIFYFGMMLGTLGSGQLPVYIGRRNSLIISGIIQTVCAICLSFSKTYQQLLLFRMGFGICYGFTYPITTSSILEIMPLKFRGKFTVLLSLFTSVGRLTAIYIGKFIIVGKVEGEWRKFVFYLALFSSFAPILCILLLNESPRFLFALKKIERGIKELDHMGRTNNSIKWIPLTEEEKYQLIQEAYKINKKFTLNALLECFSKNVRKVTICLSVIWLCMVFCEQSYSLILPFLLLNNKNEYIIFFLAYFGEIPASIVTFFFIDNVSFGRKKSIITLLICLSIQYYLSYYFRQDYMPQLFFIQRLTNKMLVAILSLYTNELYPTKLRTAGYGFNLFVSRFGPLIAPFFIFNIYKIDPFLPFLMFFFIFIVATTFMIYLRKDTTNKSLDVKVIYQKQYTSQSSLDSMESQHLIN